MKIVFLDRDGVINRYPGDKKYVISWKEFKFLPRVKKALLRLLKHGYKLFVISNQAGVAKGIYSHKALSEITRNMLKELKASGVTIHGVYYCVHTQEESCLCRKPRTGLCEKAMRQHHILPSRIESAFFIGDSMPDILTGKSAGCKTILVFTGKEKPLNQPEWPIRPDFTAADLSGAVDIIVKNTTSKAK